jgi:DNA-binding NtrC family response regulator
MISAVTEIETAVQAMKHGAYHYVTKDFDYDQLRSLVRHASERQDLNRQVLTLSAQVADQTEREFVVGPSRVNRDIVDLVNKIAKLSATVLILGESGTGKELVAGALHHLSRRSQAHYIRINCAAIPETLLESELFGHEKGAFTGALKQKQGRVEEADGGTIFLDEIADMSRPLQAKLLRFLEDGSFTRVGGTDELRVNVRLLAATNRDIVQAIHAGQFREDLFHRLNVVQIRLPALRERGEDVNLLANHFVKVLGPGMNKAVRAVSDDARQKLLFHRWPGNVRELKNVVERALILERTKEIQLTSLPPFLVEAPLPKSDLPDLAGEASLDDLLTDFERKLIGAMLERNEFNFNKTAEQLKITRHALRYRMQRLNINPDPTAEPEKSAATRKEITP